MAKKNFPIWAVEDPESYGMTEKDVKRTWQKAVDSGQVWSLQGWYGRTAADLINSGYIKLPKKSTKDFYGNPIPRRKK